MSKKLRILHLVPKYGRNNDLINNYISRLDLHHFDSVLCYMGKGPDEVLSQEGYRTHFLGYENAELRGFKPAIAWKLKLLLEERRIDILHCHKHKSVLYGTLAVLLSKRKGMKIVASVHGMRRSRTFSRRMTNRFLFPRVSNILAVSEGVRQDILQTNRGLEADKVSVVHNGIDLNRFPMRGISLEKGKWPVLGTVGRLAPTKGQTYLLQAFSRVVQRYPDASLLIAGSGPLLEELQRESIELGIDGKVKFTGFLSDIPGFLQRMDLFILPSLAEGLPIAVLEAMATGLPVIASEVGGLPEVIPDASCGRMVPPRDVQALYETILELLSRGEDRLRMMGTAARERIEKAFTLDRMVRDFEQVYASLMNRTP